MSDIMRQLPLYVCHKKVWALKIAAIVREELPTFSRPTCRGSIVFGSACGHCERCEWEKKHGQGMSTTIFPADEGFGAFTVDADYVAKHKPHAGGYYVQYADGYTSFSPAQAFEEGYTRL
jgi:hypothetical protein